MWGEGLDKEREEGGCLTSALTVDARQQSDRVSKSTNRPGVATTTCALGDYQVTVMGGDHTRNVVTPDPCVLMSWTSDVMSCPPMSSAREREGGRKEVKTAAIWLASSLVGETTNAPV